MTSGGESTVSVLDSRAQRVVATIHARANGGAVAVSRSALFTSERIAEVAAEEMAVLAGTDELSRLLEMRRPAPES